jgi:nucleoside-diphosphate-sugar epimerase
MPIFFWRNNNIYGINAAIDIDKNNMNPKILVTGASGFIGKHIILALKNHYDIWSICNNHSIELLSNKSLKIDLLDPNSVPNLKAHLDQIQFHAVLHLANIGMSNLDRKNDLESANSLVLTHLLDGLSIAPKKFGLFSSVYVYKNPLDGSAITEYSEKLPTSNYGISKDRLEKQILNWGKSNQTEITIFRPEWVYGPGDISRKLIPELVRAANSSVAYPVRINCEERRQPIYILDLVASIESWMSIDLTSKENIILTVGPESIKHIELLSLARKRAKYPGNPVIINYESSENCLNFTFNNQRSQEILNWKPTISLEKGFDLVLRSMCNL